MDEFSQHKINKVLNELEALNKEPGFTQEEFDEHLNATLEYIKKEVTEYFEDQFDPNEPRIATHNTIEMLKDLEAVVGHRATVIRD